MMKLIDSKPSSKEEQDSPERTKPDRAGSDDARYPFRKEFDSTSKEYHLYRHLYRIEYGIRILDDKERKVQ